MAKSIHKIVVFALLFMSLGFCFSQQVFADLTAPFLYFGGNYQYDVDSHSLAFSDNYADLVEYTDGTYDFNYDNGYDPVTGAAVSFGALTNSSSDPLVFSPSTVTVDGLFTATLDNFVVNGASELAYGRLQNIQRLDNGSSRYVDELIARGGGTGYLSMNFTPVAGGVEPFTADSYGAAGGMVAAPLPPSAMLFASGIATLAFGNYRRKRISQRYFKEG